MIKLKSLIKESYVTTRPDDDYQYIYDEVQREFLYDGQKYQTWRLIPARDILLLWATFSKYGRVDENKLDKIWEIIKENVLKIVINTEVWHGNDPHFFGSDIETFDEIPDKENNRHSLFISDRSGNEYVRGWSEVEGNARYSDAYKSLFKLLEKCYTASTPEELLIDIDQILNFVHGLGHMAKWFVEGGTNTLNKIRDFQAKGITLQGKLSESFFKSFEANRVGKSNYVEIFKDPHPREIKECMSGGGELGVILLDEDVYIWNRNKAVHVEVMKYINNIMTDMLPLLVFIYGIDCEIYVTDASRHTKWHGQPETAEYIENHPFFKYRKIIDLSYYDEDIVGKWDRPHIDKI